MSNNPTHIPDTGFSYIDLIFTSQPNLVIVLSVHPSLHPIFHHQINFAKFILKIHFPPPY